MFHRRNNLFDHIAIHMGKFGAGLGAGLVLVFSRDFDVMGIALVVSKVLMPLADFDEFTHLFVINRYLKLWHSKCSILATLPSSMPQKEIPGHKRKGISSDMFSNFLIRKQHVVLLNY